MRIALIIIALAGVAVGLVHIRRGETDERHEIQRLRLEQKTLRRELWDQQVRIGRLISPESIRERTGHMVGVSLVEPVELQYETAERTARQSPPNGR